ncbi:hypothetical protein MHYP_G00006030 [Metynnis hypsauchen]
MKGVLLTLLLLTLLRSSSLAGPVDRLQLTAPPGIQSQSMERGPSAKPQYVSVFSVSPRLRRAAPVVPKTPVRVCTGCFSVIGDPTIPQQ